MKPPIQLNFYRKLHLKLLLVAASLSVCLYASRSSAFEHHHALAPSYQFTRVGTERGEPFKVHSLSFDYYGRYGGDLAGFLRMSYLVPFRARQADTRFSPLNQYQKHWGFDSILGLSSRYHLLKSWDFDFGLGAHFQYIRMVSNEYVEWSTLTVGLGTQAHARHSFGSSFLGAQPEFGLLSELDFDFIDLSHNGDLAFGFDARAAVTIGLAWGGDASER